MSVEPRRKQNPPTAEILDERMKLQTAQNRGSKRPHNEDDVIYMACAPAKRKKVTAEVESKVDSVERESKDDFEVEEESVVQVG